MQLYDLVTTFYPKECEHVPSDAYASLQSYMHCPLFARRFQESTADAVVDMLDEIWVI